MDVAIIVAVISAAASVVVSALSFFFTKQKEREAEWRRQKLDHYKEYMAALNGVVGPPPTPEAKIRHANAANNLFLVGGADVLVALRVFLDSTADSANPERVRHDEFLTTLLLAIRNDLGITPDPPKSFQFKLWSGRAHATDC